MHVTHNALLLPERVFCARHFSIPSEREHESIWWNADRIVESCSLQEFQSKVFMVVTHSTNRSDWKNQLPVVSSHDLRDEIVVLNVSMCVSQASAFLFSHRELSYEWSNKWLNLVLMLFESHHSDPNLWLLWIFLRKWWAWDTSGMTLFDIGLYISQRTS